MPIRSTEEAHGKRSHFSRQNKSFLRFGDSERGVFDATMEPLRRARIRFRSTKHVLLAREQFVKHVWNCTRNGFGTRKPPAERSSRPNVLVLSSGMPQGAQTTVFVVPENAMKLKLRVSSSENRAWELTGDGSTIFVEGNARKRKKHSIRVALVNRVAARFRSTKQVLLAFF